MVMGPDCGTAIVNGIPLGFANVVRRGPIGVVGASGTGTQEVTVRIHQLGSGVSQALGTGGHDLSRRHRRHLDAARAALRSTTIRSTTVIVLVSKPPSERGRRGRARRGARHDHTGRRHLPRRRPDDVQRATIHGAAYLGRGRRHRRGAGRGRAGRHAGATSGAIDDETRRTLDDLARRMAPSQRYVRGIFSGGTFCFEAQLMSSAAGHPGFSNTPVAGNTRLADIRKSLENTIVDMGDDEFTQGRPHPMIDPSLRNDARTATKLADPTTAVVLFDVVLGYGSADDPIVGTARGHRQRPRPRPTAPGRHRRVHRLRVRHRPRPARARRDRSPAFSSPASLVASSNAEAARWSALA